MSDPINDISVTALPPEARHQRVHGERPPTFPVLGENSGKVVQNNKASLSNDRRSGVVTGHAKSNVDLALFARNSSANRDVSF